MSIRSGRVIIIVLSLSGIVHAADKANSQSASTNSAAPRLALGSTLGSTWADAAKMPDLFSGTWGNFSSFVEDDAKRNVPFTATAQKYVDAFKHKRDIPFAQEGCQSPGLPLAMRLSGGNKFTYAPGLISIYMQAVGHTRFIKMNQKQGQKQDKTSPKYYGNSVGHWEGDTLVVETEDFSSEIAFQYGVGKPLPPAETRAGYSFDIGGAVLPAIASLTAAIWGPHGEGMHMVERMRLVDAATLEVNLTVYDDTVWTKPYVMSTRYFKRIKKGVDEFGPFTAEPQEYICTVSITTFDPETNTYRDKDPEEMVKFLDKMGR